MENRDGFRLVDKNNPFLGGLADGLPPISHQFCLDGKFPSAEKDEELVLQCGSGYRSNIAASIMKQAGYTNLKSLAGGIFAWSSSGFPVVSN